MTKVSISPFIVILIPSNTGEVSRQLLQLTQNRKQRIALYGPQNQKKLLPSDEGRWIRFSEDGGVENAQERFSLSY